MTFGKFISDREKKLLRGTKLTFKCKNICSISVITDETKILLEKRTH
jgi:hypothetical protein